MIRPLTESDTADAALLGTALRLHASGLRMGSVLDELADALRSRGMATDVRIITGNADVPVRAEGLLQVAITHEGGPVIGHLRCRPTSSAHIPDITLLAQHAAVAWTVAERTEELTRAARTARVVSERLQNALLPPLPEVPGCALNVAYRAAALHMEVGGDFYDVLALPDERVLITVGDVVGKGLDAASRTTIIRHTLRALAMQNLELDELLEQVDRQVTYQDPEMMATIWCGLYEPESGELSFASLGHPPALLLRHHGEPLSLWLEGLPLGLRDLVPESPEIRTRSLGPGDALVLYTDGVVEFSGDLAAGLTALVQAVEERLAHPTGELAEDVIDHLLTGASHVDDALLLILRRRGAAGLLG